MKYLSSIVLTATLTATLFSCNKSDKTTNPNGTNPNGTDTSHHSNAAKLNRPELLGTWEYTGFKFSYYDSTGALTDSSGSINKDTSDIANDVRTLITFYEADSFVHRKLNGNYEGAALDDNFPYQGGIWSGQSDDTAIVMTTIGINGILPERWTLLQFSATSMEIEHRDTAANGDRNAIQFTFIKR